jgi:hypothetical protein
MNTHLSRHGVVSLMTLASMSVLACSAAPVDGASNPGDPRSGGETAASGATSTAGLNGSPGDTTCVPYKEAERVAARIDEKNDTAFRAAVAARGLELVKLHEEVMEISSKPSEPAWSEKAGLGPTGRTLFAPPSEVWCGGSPTSGYDLAKDAAGQLFYVWRQPHASEGHAVRACGCEADLPPRGCGTPPRSVQWRFDLPPTLVFKGEKAIEYPVETTQIDFAGHGNGPCPMPVPLP